MASTDSVQMGALSSVNATSVGSDAAGCEMYAVHLAPSDVQGSASSDSATWGFFVSLALIVAIAIAVCCALLITRLRVAMAGRVKRAAVTREDFTTTESEALTYAA